MGDKLNEKEISYTYMLSDQDAYVIFKPDGDFINPQRLCEHLNALEQRVEGLERAEIRVGADDEYVHGPLFHMERMHEGHIWFRIGDEAFDLYASDGTRLTWVPQTSGGWDTLAAEEES